MSEDPWIVPLDDHSVEASVATVGGKGANLLRLRRAGFTVPDGFIVSAVAYREFLEHGGIAGDVTAALDVDPADSSAVAATAERAQECIGTADVPSAVAADIESAYEAIGSPRVAVRSSASAEDLPEASFAGQQETYLNVTGTAALLERVQDCWASLYTPRAITYRADAGFDHDAVDISVVVQELVDADRSGVLFTADPSTGAREMTVEAVRGLGEGVVSGELSPDTYVVDRETGDLVEEVVSTQGRMVVPGADEITTEPVPEARRGTRILGSDDLAALTDLGERIEDHYGTPQDVEWAIANGEIHVLQSRPITTIDESTQTPTTSEDAGTLTGLGASPGVAEGKVCFDPITAAKWANDGQQLILVREMTSPSDLHGMKAAEGILTSRGGRTCHAAIVARELDKPAVVGCDALTIDEDDARLVVDGRTIEQGDPARIDGTTGTVEFPE